MNAEKMAAERRMSNDENVEAAGAAGSDPRMIMIDEDDFGQEAAENQLAAISTTHY